MKLYSIRILKDRLLKTMVIILSVLTCVPLILIIGKVLLKGYRQINLSFSQKRHRVPWMPCWR